MTKAVFFLVVLLTTSCAKQTITTTHTYDKALPFSKTEIKKVEANQEATCAQYAAKSNIRIKRMEAINAAMDAKGMTQKQKKAQYDHAMSHLNDGLEDTEQLKDKCDALNKQLDDMYQANHKAGDQYLDQLKRK